MKNMTKSALETVHAFQQSLGSGSGEWKNLLAEDIVFHGPVDRVKGREANIKLNESFFPIVRGVNMIRTMEQGDMVATQVEFKLAAPSGKEITLEMAEFYEVRDGKIQNIRVYYDAEEFRVEFGMKQAASS